MTTEIENAAAILKSGQPVIFPTDTVWGIGVSVAHCSSPEVLFDIKGRPASKPIAWLVSGIDDLYTYGNEINNYVLELAKANWPGATTLVVNASEAVPSAYQSDAGTIALRMPDCKFVCELISAAGSPLATTSANLSGHSPCASNIPLDDSFMSVARNRDIYIVDNSFICPNNSIVGKPSQVIDCTGKTPMTLRY